MLVIQGSFSSLLSSEEDILRELEELSLENQGGKSSKDAASGKVCLQVLTWHFQVTAIMSVIPNVGVNCETEPYKVCLELSAYIRIRQSISGCNFTIMV